MQRQRKECKVCSKNPKFYERPKKIEKNSSRPKFRLELRNVDQEVYLIITLYILLKLKQLPLENLRGTRRTRSTNSTIGKSRGESNLTPQYSKPIVLLPAKNAIERLKMLLKKN